MLTTRKQYTKDGFFSIQEKLDCHNRYVSFPLPSEIKDDKLIIDGYEPPDDNELKTLSDVATEIYKLYGLLDNRHHDFTLATFVLERLFTMLHQGAYGDYLHKHNFVSEVERLARTEEVTYVPMKPLPKGAMFELKSMADVSVASSSIPLVPTASSRCHSYGK
jgi:hypothetical protein